MITLYLCRHGIAEEIRGRMKDADRKLTREGRRKFRETAEGFRELVGKKEIVKILTSPLVRARGDGGRYWQMCWGFPRWRFSMR